VLVSALTSTFHFRVALGSARVSSSWWPLRVRRASAVATRADAPEPRSFGPYAPAVAAIRGSPRDICLTSAPLGLSQRPGSRGWRSPRGGPVRPAVAAILSGRAAMGGHSRCPPHARATGRGGAGRPPPSEHADAMNAGRRAPISEGARRRHHLRCSAGRGNSSSRKSRAS
jgi:hypothetical protein